MEDGSPTHWRQSHPGEGGPGLYNKGSFEHEPGRKPLGSALHGLSAAGQPQMLP